MVLSDDLEGWDEAGGSFKREGKYVYLWLIHVDIWQKPRQYYKAIIFQLKKKFFFKENPVVSSLGKTRGGQTLVIAK